MTWSEFLATYNIRVKHDEPLAKHTSMHVGGGAQWYFEAKTREELEHALGAARSNGIKIAILGGGSNSLFADHGFDGFVLRPLLAGIRIQENGMVRGEAGLMSALLARKSAEAGLTGLEWAVTLPGTIGGAVRGNAGCFGGEIKDTLVNVEVLRGGETITVPAEACAFAYRDSCFKRNLDDVILAATFKLTPAPKAECLARIDEVIAKRKATQPLGTSSAGCMFKNPMIDGKLVPAGKLIDEAGLKGFCIGGACVSEMHGNFLVVEKTATADHILQLVSAIKTKIRNQFGVQLEEEVQLYT